MKFFVTGATGLVGRELVRQLIEASHQVVAFHRPGSKIANLGCATVEGDLSSPVSLSTAMNGCDGVFHVAGNTSWWRRDRQEVRNTNVDSTHAVLQAMRIAGIRRGVLTSSVSAVGITDDPLHPADETTPFNWPGRFHYPRSKRDADEMWRRDGFVSVNPATIFGPGDARMKVGVLFLRILHRRFPRLLRGGFSTVDVRDVARAHLLAFERGRPGERYILSGENLEYAAFGSLVAQELGVDPPSMSLPPFAIRTLAALTRFYEFLGGRTSTAAGHLWCMTRHVFHSAEKAKRELGFTSRPFRETLRDSIAWYRHKGLLNG